MAYVATPMLTRRYAALLMPLLLFFSRMPMQRAAVVEDAAAALLPRRCTLCQRIAGRSGAMVAAFRCFRHCARRRRYAMEPPHAPIRCCRAFAIDAYAIDAAADATCHADAAESRAPC